MKRFILATILLLFLAPLVFPDVSDGGQIVYPPKVPYLRYTSDNTTGIYKTTDVSSAIIDPSTCKILGFEVIAIASGGEYVATLHDTTTTISDSTIYGELETGVDNFAGVFFPYPAKIVNGIRIIQGGQTRVIVFYTRY